MLKLPLDDALKQLDDHATDAYRVLDHGDWDFCIYRPEGREGPGPRQRDALYVIAVGEGIYRFESDRQAFVPGDAFFAPAGIDHRFEDFSDDFAAWVVLFGPRPH